MFIAIFTFDYFFLRCILVKVSVLISRIKFSARFQSQSGLNESRRTAIKSSIFTTSTSELSIRSPLRSVSTVGNFVQTNLDAFQTP